MKETKLTWFDRVMVGITFAEAGAEEPVMHTYATLKTDNMLTQTRRRN